MRLVLIFIISLTSSIFGDLIVFDALEPSGNETRRTEWLEEVEIPAAHDRLDFEDGSFSDGDNISGISQVGGLVITDSSAAGEVIIEDSSTLLGGSNPVGDFSAAHNEGTSLVLDFTASPIDYLGFLEIDTLGVTYTIRFEDGTSDSYKGETTGANGDTAEFIGFFRNDQARITQVEMDSENGDNEWGIDNLEYGRIELLYVDGSAKGVGNGESWEDAFLTLQEALMVADSNDRILIAEGTYYPDEMAGPGVVDNKFATFTLIAGLQLFGGYPAGGGVRDTEAHLTVLSGDIEQNDVNDDGNGIPESRFDIVGENSLRVINTQRTGSFVTRPITICGVTVTAGHALAGNGNLATGVGAGIGVIELSMTLREVSVVGNHAENGGAGISYNGSAIHGLTAVDCNFKNNSLAREGGGATFGAALNIFSANAEITGCHFEGNTIVSNVTLFALSGRGVAISCRGDIEREFELKIRDSSFTNHRFEGENGLAELISIIDFGSVSMERCVIAGNELSPVDGQNGGTVLRILGVEELLVSNSLIHGNFCDNIFNTGGPAVTDFRLENCSVVQNNCDKLFLHSPASFLINFDVVNTISSSRIFPFGSPNLSLSRSVIRGETGILDYATLDPEFVAPRPAEESPTTLGNYRLRGTSSLVDFGLLDSVTAQVDLLGFSRIFDGNQDGVPAPDVGAYEFDNSPTPAPLTMEVIDHVILASGDVVFTVNCSRATPFLCQYNAGLAPAHWEIATTGDFNAGENNLRVNKELFEQLEDKAFFRFVDQ